MRRLTSAALAMCLLFTSQSTFALSLYDSDWQLDWDLQNIERQLDELNRGLQRDRSTDTFRRISDLRQQILDKFRSLGIDAFYPSNEGEIRAGIAQEPTCPAKSHAVTDFCACDDGYSYDFLSFSCVDTQQIIKTTEDLLNGATKEIENEMRKSGNESKATCALIQQHLALLDQLYKAADDKLQNVAGVYAPAIRTSLGMIGDYSKELELLYDEQCTQKTTNTSSQKLNNAVALPPDVTNDVWYSTALSTFIDAGWLSAQQSFRPSDMATREEVIRLIVEMNGGILSTPPSQSSFDDVPTDSVAFGWFEEAAKEGWIAGQGDCYGKHPCLAKPNDPINRAEAAALMIRAFGLTQGDAPSFEDVPAGAWYGDIIRTAASLCILRGDSGSTRVRPAANMNRAEMIVMLWRVDQGLAYPNCQ